MRVGSAAATARLLLHGSRGLHCRGIPAAACCRCLQICYSVVLKVLSQQAQAVAGRHAGVPLAVPQVGGHGDHHCRQLLWVRGSDASDLGSRCLAGVQRRAACGSARVQEG